MGPLKIAPNWTIDDIKTLEDCDRARDLAQAAIIEIENQIRAAQAHRYTTGEHTDPDWYRRAYSALKLKRLVLQKIQEIRGRLSREERKQSANARDRALLDTIKEIAPDMFERALTEARLRYPQLW
jgi:hypothetical protein